MFYKIQILSNSLLLKIKILSKTWYKIYIIRILAIINAFKT